MRVGTNPAKSLKKAPKPAPLTVVILTYIPYTSGYYRESLAVFQACLESLWASTTEMPFEVLVFDNGSGPETRAFLQEAHRACLRPRPGSRSSVRPRWGRAWP